MVREVKVTQSISNKAPRNGVIGFRQVNFEDHQAVLTFLFRYVLNHLLSNYDIINRTSPPHKATLVRTNQLVNPRFDSISDSFSDNFVNDIAQTNGTKVRRPNRVITLRDKNDIGLGDIGGM